MLIGPKRCRTLPFSFGPKSVDIKISTTETDNLLLIKEALKNFKKVFINVSGYEKEYINLIIKKFVNKRTKNQIIFLYGFYNLKKDKSL